MKDKRRKLKLIMLLIAILCFLYLSAKGTYTSFESLITGRATQKTAGIVLKINDVNVVNGLVDNTLLLNNLTWTSTHSNPSKIAPGSTGSIDLELDPTGSEVAILYEFQFIDYNQDSSKLLTFENITCDGQFVRTGVDTYSGIIPLSAIANGDTITVSLDFLFDASVDIEGITEDNHDLDDLFEIHFHAVQYRGETLVPYVEPTPEPEPEPNPEPEP